MEEREWEGRGRVAHVVDGEGEGGRKQRREREKARKMRRGGKKRLSRGRVRGGESWFGTVRAEVWFWLGSAHLAWYASVTEGETVVNNAGFISHSFFPRLGPLCFSSSM